MAQFGHRRAIWLAMALALVLTLGLAQADGAFAHTSGGLGTACPAIYPVPEYCQHPEPQVQLAPVSYTGWVYLNLNYCPPGALCAAVYRSAMQGWRWDYAARTWRSVQVPGGRVYVGPYSGNWRWVCTGPGACSVVSGGRFELRPNLWANPAVPA